MEGKDASRISPALRADGWNRAQVTGIVRGGFDGGGNSGFLAGLPGSFHPAPPPPPCRSPFRSPRPDEEIEQDC